MLQLCVAVCSVLCCCSVLCYRSVAFVVCVLYVVHYDVLLSVAFVV